MLGVQIAWLGKYLAGARDNIEKSDLDAPCLPPPPTCPEPEPEPSVSTHSQNRQSGAQRDIRASVQSSV